MPLIRLKSSWPDLTASQTSQSNRVEAKHSESNADSDSHDWAQLSLTSSAEDLQELEILNADSLHMAREVG